MDKLFVLSALGLGFSLAMLIFYNWSLAHELRISRRETSRFPLFAVRDRLVGLVVSDAMKEKDPAWRTAYANVNALLYADEEFSLPSVLFFFVRHVLRTESDAALKRRAEKDRSTVRSARDRDPVFDEILRERDDAFFHMLSRNTRGILRRAAMIGLAALALAFVALARGKQSARAVRVALSEPSAFPSNIARGRRGALAA